jgi:hypothetical protein
VCVCVREVVLCGGVVVVCVCVMGKVCVCVREKVCVTVFV